jgi:hypothetical protein
VEDLQGREAEGLGFRGGKGNSRVHQIGLPNLSHGSLINNQLIMCNHKTRFKTRRGRSR